MVSRSSCSFWAFLGRPSLNSPLFSLAKLMLSWRPGEATLRTLRSSEKLTSCFDLQFSWLLCLSLHQHHPQLCLILLWISCQQRESEWAFPSLPCLFAFHSPCQHLSFNHFGPRVAWKNLSREDRGRQILTWNRATSAANPPTQPNRNKVMNIMAWKFPFMGISGGKGHFFHSPLCSRGNWHLESSSQISLFICQ